MNCTVDLVSNFFSNAISSSAFPRIQKSTSELDTVIAQCDDSIQTILRFKSSVLRLKNSRNSPVQRLPRELLDIIMLLACDASENPNSAFLLAGVCAAWREVALENPMLWSRVSFSSGHVLHGEDLRIIPFSTRMDVLRTQLDRSGDGPVHADLQDFHDDYDFDAEGVQVASVFTEVSVAVRLDTLVLNANFLNTFYLSNNLDEGFTWPSLKSITVQGRMHRNSAPDLFLDSPCLIHVSLSHGVHHIHLPWSQILHLELSRETGFPETSSLICPNMTSFTFRSLKPMNPGGNTPVIFPTTVKKVRLHPGATNLDYLMFPGMETLELNCLSVKPHQLLDRNFLRRPSPSAESSGVRELVFTTWGFPQGTLLDLLLIVPNLEILSISGRAQSNDSFSDAFARLSCDDIVSEVAAPKLKRFEVKNRQANVLDLDGLVRFVQKRSRSRGGTLEHLELVFKTSLFSDDKYVIREPKKAELRQLARPSEGFTVLVE